MNRDYIPRNDAEFNSWVGLLFTHIENNNERIKIPEAKFSLLKDMDKNWKEKYRITESPTTRTSPSIIEKDRAREVFEKELRLSIKEYITYNRDVTDGDRQAMGLPVHKSSRTPVPVPSSIPVYYMDTSILRRITIHYRDQSGASNRKPNGVHGAEIAWIITDITPSSADVFTHSNISTRSPFTLEFNEEQRGKSIHLCLRWENTKGQKGPWGEILKVLVP